MSRKRRGKSRCSFRGMIGKFVGPHGARSELIIAATCARLADTIPANKKQNCERTAKGNSKKLT